MKYSAFASTVAVVLASGVCFAQPRNPAPAAGNDNQAVATTAANSPAPAKGANSFTMAQAKNRIEQEGFSDVSGLSKDDNGVWHGRATKDGTASMVWLDYKGNVGQSR